MEKIRKDRRTRDTCIISYKYTTREISRELSRELIYCDRTGIVTVMLNIAN